MTTLPDLLNAQAAAGARYQDAVDRFYAAYIELAAIDGALANSGVNDRHVDVRSFAPLAADLRPFDHPVFAPLRLPGDWREVIAQKRDELIKSASVQRAP